MSINFNFVLIPTEFGWHYYKMHKTHIFLNEYGTVCIQDGYLQDLLVFPHHRRKHHGTGLVLEAMRKAREIGLSELKIHTITNDTAARFWKRKFMISRTGGYLRILP